MYNKDLKKSLNCSFTYFDLQIFSSFGFFSLGFPPFFWEGGGGVSSVWLGVQDFVCRVCSEGWVKKGLIKEFWFSGSGVFF